MNKYVERAGGCFGGGGGFSRARPRMNACILDACHASSTSHLDNGHQPRQQQQRRRKEWVALAPLGRRAASRHELVRDGHVVEADRGKQVVVVLLKLQSHGRLGEVDAEEVLEAGQEEA
eukprot:363565-Chlamydomonas_euryale.AAC.7